MSTAIAIKVEGMCGANVQDVIGGMVALARRTGCLVTCDVNSIYVLVDEESDVAEVHSRWLRALEKGHKAV